MSPLSWPVALGTLAVCSPALRAVWEGTLSPDVAVVRALICLVAVWAACSLVASISAKTVAANSVTETRIDLEPIGVSGDDGRREV